MISFISGKVGYAGENFVIVENNGLGYEVVVSNNTLVKCRVGESIKLYTYMQVKEDGISLFGFLTEEEKSMFLRLIGISGIGPKVALALLSGMRADELALAILYEDTRALTRIKGMGKKTAERIILELKEKVSPMEALMRQSVRDVSGEKEPAGESAEAFTVLISLGMTRQEAARKVKAAEDSGLKNAEEILNFALRNKT